MNHLMKICHIEYKKWYKSCDNLDQYLADIYVKYQKYI